MKKIFKKIKNFIKTKGLRTVIEVGLGVILYAVLGLLSYIPLIGFIFKYMLFFMPTIYAFSFGFPSVIFVAGLGSSLFNIILKKPYKTVELAVSMIISSSLLTVLYKKCKKIKNKILRVTAYIFSGIFCVLMCAGIYFLITVGPGVEQIKSLMVDMLAMILGNSFMMLILNLSIEGKKERE